MGVPSLVPLIVNNPSLMRKMTLQDCELVIDGNCLENHLYNKTNIDKTHGGDYNVYSTTVENFFKTLLRFGITPTVVFDGGYEVDNRKLETVLQRAQKRIDDPKNFAPLLTHETFVHILNKLNIKHVTCDFEADSEMVVLANRLECPLLSFDSDFFVFEVNMGYIPIEELNVKVMARGAILSKIEIKVYYTQQLVRKFPYLEGKLALLATSLGNDYVSKDSFQPFYQSLKLPRPDRNIFEIKDAHFCAIIRKVLFWLESNPLEKCKRTLVAFCNSEQRQLVQLSIDTFSNSSKYSSFNLQRFLKNKTVDDDDICEGMTKWLVLNHRLGNLSNFIQNTILNQRNILFCQVEDNTKKSSHACSLKMRSAIYGILHGPGEVVTEFDREMTTLKKRQVPGVLINVGKNHIPMNLNSLNELEYNAKIAILRKAINGTMPDDGLVELNKGSILFLMIFMFWFKKSGFQLESVLVQSILYSFIVLSFKNRSVDRVLVGNIEIWLNSSDEPDILTLSECHALAELQSCLKYGIVLNKLLELPLCDIDPGTVFSGSLINKTYCLMKHRKFEPNLRKLRIKSEIAQFYDHVVAFVQGNA